MHYPSILLAVFLASLIFSSAPVAANTRPLPLAQGGHCGFLLPCARSGPLAMHMRFTLLVEDVEAASMIRPWGAFGLSASLWEWAEIGASFQLGMGRGEEAGGGPGYLQGPITLWGRFSPPSLAALFSPKWTEGLFLAAQLEHAIAPPHFDQGGQLLQALTTVSLVAEERWGRLHASLVGGAQGGPGYRGLQGGAALRILVSKTIGLQVGGEVLGRVGWGESGLQTGWVAVLSLTALDEWGIEGGLGYLRADGAGLPRSAAIVQGGWSIGPKYKKPDARLALRTIPPWLMRLYERIGMIIDPVLRSDGWIVDDDGRPLYHAADPDPDHPGHLRFRRGGQSFAPGTHFYRSGRTLLTLDGQPVEDIPAGVHLDPQAATDRAIEDARKRKESESCAYCRPQPLPLGDGAPGYAAGCALVRYVGCGIKPGEDKQSPVGQLGPLGPLRGPRMGIASSPPSRGSWRPPAPQPPSPKVPTGEAVHVRPAAHPAPGPQAGKPAPVDSEAVHVTPPSGQTPRGGVAPVRKGQEGVAAVAKTVDQLGGKVRGGEVTVKTTQGPRKMDLLVEDPHGTLQHFEVKTGPNARRTPVQKSKDEEIRTQGGVAVGKNAERAGVAGPIKVETKVIKVP